MPARDDDGDGGRERPPAPLFPPAVRDLSEWVLRRMTPINVLLHVALIAPLQFRVMPFFINAVADAQRAAVASGAAPSPPAGPLLPDFRLFGLSSETLDQTLAAFGPHGREAYGRLLRVDLLYALGYGLFFGDVQGIVANLAGVRRGPWRALHLLPWIAASFDVLEDLFLAACLHCFDARTGRVEPEIYRALVSLLASAAIQLKWASLAVAGVALTLTLMRGIVRLGLFLGSYVCGKRGGGGRRRGRRGASAAASGRRGHDD
jgi:hypothetical protein